MRYLLILWLFFASLVRAEAFLDPQLAFQPSVSVQSPGQLRLDVKIAPGYYVYRDKFRFGLPDGRAMTLGPAAFPAGKLKSDPNFGDVEIYQGQVAITLPLSADAGQIGETALLVTLQGCAEAGVCYPPQAYELPLNLTAGDLAEAPPTSALASDESGLIANKLQSSGFLVNLAFFFLAGLGLSLTPCVFPMIPILSGIIAGQGDAVTRGRGMALSLAYVLGMALTYSLAGVAAGLSGSMLSAALQNPWVLGLFAGVFVVLSLSMFGFYDLQLPASMQTRLSDGAGHLQGGRGLAVFLMGAMSALIVGPCVAAPLAGALLYIGQSGNAFLGGAALFVMALGMGVPLLLIGFSAGSLLPRAGMWMEGVKKTFGVLLLATAVWLVSPVIPVAAQMLAWAALLIASSIYLHALDPLPAGAKGWQRFWKGAGIIMLLFGSALLIGMLAGNRDPLQPLAGLQAAGQAQAAEASGAPRFERVSGLAELERRLATAEKPVILDFYADWCVSCKEMERLTFSDVGVRKLLTGFTSLQADVTANSASDKALLKRFGLFGPPAILFFDVRGREAGALKVIGFQAAQRFSAQLERALAELGQTLVKP